MRFRMLDEVFQRFPQACIGLVVAYGLDNRQSSAAILALLREAEARVARTLGERDLRDVEALALWRKAFADAGINSGRFKSSVEALVQRVTRGAQLPDLNPAVNLANFTSLTYLVPVGSHDLDGLTGDLEVGPAKPGALFTPLGQSDQEQVEAGEFVYADAQEVRTRRWVWRQSERSKVTAASRNVVFPLDGWHGHTDDAVRAAQAVLARYLQQELGGQVRTFFLDRDHREATINRPHERADALVPDDSGFHMAGRAYLERSQHDSTDDPPAHPVADSAPVAAPAAGGLSRRERWATLDAIGTLLERGVVDVVVREELEARLRKGYKLRVKFGVDPTSPQLHLGHAVVLRKLRAFQQLGHTICLVIGDFTAQIGDASDRNAMRQMLSEETVYQNLASYRKQISRILDEKQVEWTYNADWLGPLRFKDVVGLAANFTVAQMLERENFTNRYTAGQPIGLQEFLYPLMQGYDSVALKADVELGGTEQLFNLLAGRTLQKAFGQQPQAVMTLTLLLGLDGTKMSKSKGNWIALEDPAVDMYGKLMSIPDELILPYFELCTDVPLAELSAIDEDIARGTNPMVHKKRLAFEVTKLYHTPAQARKAQETFERVVQGRAKPEEMTEVQLDRAGTWGLLDVLVAVGLTRTKSEARRKVGEGAVWVDDQRIADPGAAVEVRDGLEVRLGRHYRRVRVSG